MGRMHPDLAALFDRQDGVATAAQILAVVSRRHLELLLGCTAVERIWHGVYSHGAADDARKLRGLDVACGQDVASRGYHLPMRLRLLAVAVLTAALAASLAPSASAAPASDAAATKVADCLGKLVSRPTEIVFSCADANVEITGLTWTSWGAEKARGTGTYRVNRCKPDCASGKFFSTKATITLTRVRGDKPAFTRAVLRYVHRNGEPEVEALDLPTAR